MKWGLQHVKVTLEEQDSGETVVIEQSSDGRVTCERVGGARREKAANSAPKTKAEVKVEAAPEPKPERDRKSETKKAEAKTAKAEEKPKGARKTSAKRKAAEKGASNKLDWRPIKDHGFDGFGAESGVGMFKVLHTKSKQWALFYEVKGWGAKKIACFIDLKAAQDRARMLHKEGWPEFEPLTASKIGDACPVPTGKGKDEEEKPMTKTEPKTEEKPAAPPPVSKAEADQDKELLSSFGAELDAVLDEDEDD